MQRRFLPIAILTGIFFVAALVGYLIPDRSDSPPVRILLDNKGGKVIFSHQTHSKTQDSNCATCHHTSGNDQTPPKCATCHVKKFDEVFLADHQDAMDEKQCFTCHHPKSSIANFSHDNHAEDYSEDNCQACHHDESIEPEPQACSDCHGDKPEDDIPSLKDANHSRCADCHSDTFDKGINGCGYCHTREEVKPQPPDTAPCADCHAEPVDQLVPTRTKAFHGQCMTCHEEQGAGPYKDDACYQCHMK